MSTPLGSSRELKNKTSVMHHRPKRGAGISERTDRFGKLWNHPNLHTVLDGTQNEYLLCDRVSPRSRWLALNLLQADLESTVPPASTS